MAKSASKPRIPVCVRFIPEAFAPPWPAITATAPALPAAFRKSPKMANRISPLFFVSPCMTTITIFPESRDVFLTSSSISKRFTGTTSPSAPPVGVDPVQPIASTCSGLRIGSSNSPCAVPRVHPRQSWYFSLCTFSRPMAFILATPHSSAFLSAGVPVTRAPMSSLSSVRYWKACESIIPSPAILTSAGFVPSSSGPFGVGRLSARAVHAPPKENPIATTAASAKTRRISSLPAPFGAQKPYHAVRRPRSQSVSVDRSTLVAAATPSHPRLYRAGLCLYTVFEDSLKLPCIVPTCLRSAVAIVLLAAPWVRVSLAQEVSPKPAEKPAEKNVEKAVTPEKTENPAQIELLETRYRFEANGDSRKEVHTRVHINNELGVRQFARLNFDYNRSFESIGIPLVHITHPSGGTADILPGAITDNPNPAVVNAPAYQDVRVKSVRILGLEPGDLLEYRIITTITHHPLAPDFWLDHSFDHSGIVSEEIFTLNLPAPLNITTKTVYAASYHPPPVIYVNPSCAVYDFAAEEDSTRFVYRWGIAPLRKLTPATDDDGAPVPDVIVTSFPHWPSLQASLSDMLTDWSQDDRVVAKSRLGSLSPDAISSYDKLLKSYEFVSSLTTVDLPVGTTGFRHRTAREILESSYATPEEKCFLLTLMANLAGSHAEI